MNNRIREICKAKNITISKVIKDTGSAKSYIYSVVNGDSVPTIRKAREISKVLGATLEEVFPEEVQKTIKS
jgi:putative transcriptional regulator